MQKTSAVPVTRAEGSSDMRSKVAQAGKDITAASASAKTNGQAARHAVQVLIALSSKRLFTFSTMGGELVSQLDKL